MPSVTSSPAPGNAPQLLTIEDAAALLGLAPGSLRADRGKHTYRLLPADAYVKLGSAVRVRADRLAEHVRHCTTPAPEPMPFRVPATRGWAR